MSVMEHSRHNAKWTSGIHSDKFPVFYSVLIRFYLKVGIHETLKSNGFGKKLISVRDGLRVVTKIFGPAPT